MIFNKGKGVTEYYNSGFRNYGCLMSLLLSPLQILWVALKTVIDSIKR